MSGRGVGTILAPAPRPRSGLGLNDLLGAISWLCMDDHLSQLTNGVWIINQHLVRRIDVYVEERPEPRGVMNNDAAANVLWVCDESEA